MNELGSILPKSPGNAEVVIKRSEQNAYEHVILRQYSGQKLRGSLSWHKALR